MLYANYCILNLNTVTWYINFMFQIEQKAVQNKKKTEEDYTTDQALYKLQAIY